jgi:hypothetical protein
MAMLVFMEEAYPGQPCSAHTEMPTAVLSLLPGKSILLQLEAAPRRVMG